MNVQEDTRARRRGTHRPAILAAASRVFQQEGYSRATMADVALESGLTKRTLYRYFDSKDDLLVGIYDDILARRIRLESDGAAGTAEDAFRIMAGQCLEIVTSFPGEMRFLTEEFPYLPKVYSETAMERRDEHLRLFRKTLTRGQEDGSFKKWDINLLALATFIGLSSAHQWFERATKHLAPDALGAVFSDLYLFGVADADARLRSELGQDNLSTSPEESHQAFAETSLDEQISRPWESNATLVRILEVAGQLFMKNGYDHTSSREIAAAAGITKSSLYYMVTNKEEILYFLTLSGTIDGVRTLQAILASDLRPQDAFEAAIRAHCHLVHDNLEAIRVFSSESRFLESEHRAVILAQRQRYLQTFSRLVGRLRPSSEPADPLADEILADMLLGTLNSMQFWYSRGGRLGVESIAHILTNLLTQGISTQPMRLLAR